MNLNREILRLSLPAIVSNITVPLLGLVDTTISGHLGSETFIGAIAVGSMMMNVAFWLFGFLRMGTTGLTSQALGASDRRLCYKLLYQAWGVSMSVGLLLVVFRGAVLSIVTMVIDADAAVAALAARYFDICIWEAPALLSTMVILGWFLGMQDTVRPMMISVGVNVINILFSLVFVFGFHLGFEGVALGTLCANWCGFVLALILLWRFSTPSGGMIPVCFSELMRAADLKRFFSVNTDIFFRSACIMSVSLAVTAIGARLGSLELAANAVIMQFFLFFSYFMDGLAFTGEALVGRFAGASDRRMIYLSIHRILMWAGIIAAVFFTVYASGCRPIIALITDQPEVIAYAATLYWFIVLIPPVTVAAFVFDGFYIGLTATRPMLVVTSASALIFFAICFIHISGSSIAFSLPTNATLWTAFLLYLLCRGAFLAILAPRSIRRSISTM